jgi:hypothetical protein
MKLGSESPIFMPDPNSKQAISRNGFSTLIPRGEHRDRKRADKVILCLSQRNKPRIPLRQNMGSGKNGPLGHPS